MAAQVCGGRQVLSWRFLLPVITRMNAICGSVAFVLHREYDCSRPTPRPLQFLWQAGRGKLLRPGGIPAKRRRAETRGRQLSRRQNYLFMLLMFLN